MLLKGVQYVMSSPSTGKEPTTKLKSNLIWILIMKYPFSLIDDYSKRPVRYRVITQRFQMWIDGFAFINTLVHPFYIKPYWNISVFRGISLTHFVTFAQTSILTESTSFTLGLIYVNICSRPSAGTALAQKLDYFNHVAGSELVTQSLLLKVAIINI